MEFDFFVDQIYQDYNLIELNEEQIKNEENGDVDDTPLITYSKLPLLEQIDVLYNLIKLSNTKSYSNFRKVVDKFEKPQLSLKIHPIYTIDKQNTRSEYIILQDARLYLRRWEYTDLALPLKRSEYDSKVKIPYEDLQPLEPAMIHWECLTAGIYQYDDLIKELKKSFGKKTSSDEYALSKQLEENIDFIVQHDLKKRKQGAQRKREIEMQMLMANRKRSSRLEEKERRKKEEEEERMKEFEIIKQQAAEMRAAKRQKLKESMYTSPHESNQMSREERLRKRQEISNSSSISSNTTTQHADDSIIEVEKPSTQDVQETTALAAPSQAQVPPQATTAESLPPATEEQHPPIPEKPIESSFVPTSPTAPPKTIPAAETSLTGTTANAAPGPNVNDPSV
ncbi:hypothetical protein PMKS-001389 [Pichia membranifaciens]|uniref:Uncharacterized protein n=1 Tax=Pichia membranifaciens TaxID=4926 RepID=A0A1Q2YEK6_9ASCO|nr:hypothetical protein PMKS-001389 [Pichia membranifaciens]